ncbi:MAG: hypothetical protein ACRYGR_02375 [Janthinobacterium lividum]
MPNPLFVVRSAGLTLWPIMRWFLASIAILTFAGVPITLAIMAYIIVQSQKDPGIHIARIATKQFETIDSNQVAITTTYDVRKGCVGSVSRGYARVADAATGRLEIQTINAAPTPVGVTAEDLTEDSPTVTQIHQTAQRHQVTMTEYIANPMHMRAGDDWRYVQFLSQTGCGWLHGLVPINTTMTIGPKVVIK